MWSRQLKNFLRPHKTQNGGKTNWDEGTLVTVDHILARNTMRAKALVEEKHQGRAIDSEGMLGNAIGRLNQADNNALKCGLN